MSFSLDQVPKIKITEIKIDSDSIIYKGTFDKTPIVETNHLAYLIDKTSFIDGKFLEVDPNYLSVIFKTANRINILSEYNSYPVLDTYWGERAELVLDERKKWAKKYFVSTDAEHFNKDNISGWVEAGNKLPEGAESTGIGKDGWEHEHCSICWQKISPSEVNNEYGLVDDELNWICTNCFLNYVEKRSLDFIKINQ